MPVERTLKSKSRKLCPMILQEPQSEPNSPSSSTKYKFLPKGHEVEIRFTGLNNLAFVNGFTHLWAAYVRGFNPKQHCQKAFLGRISNRIKTRTTLVGEPLILDETGDFDSLYICGVSSGSVRHRKFNNLHLPLQHQHGETCSISTYNGYTVSVRNAILIPVPPLPEGWQGLPRNYTSCRNFQFCVHRFGYPCEI
jgi:hypothetical protein